MKKQQLKARIFLCPTLGCASILGACSGTSEMEPSAATVDVGYPLKRADPSAIRAIDPNDYPEIVVPARADRPRTRRPFTGMVP